MGMPEVFTDVWKVCGGSREQIVGYEHVVGLLLPWRRYNKDIRPRPCEGSPSKIDLGPEERHGALLTVSRITSSPSPNSDDLGEMFGELAEAWATLRI
jgi:hypothetical protein